MRNVSCFFIVAACIMSSACVEQGKTQPEPGPTSSADGWKLLPPATEATAVATKERLRGLYPAGCKIDDDKAPGGFGPCNNYAFELGNKDWGTKGRISLVAFPEEQVA